jgi:hypothetical protein
MKKIIVLVLGLIFFVTAFAPDAAAQDRRRRHRGLATNATIVGGSTVAGALIGRGRNGAMVGAGAGLLYASSRKGTKRRHRNSKTRRYSKIAGGALLGAGTGAMLGGKKGMIIGGLGGAGGSYIYTKRRKRVY